VIKVVDEAPKPIRECIERAEADKLKSELEETGGRPLARSALPPPPSAPEWGATLDSETVRRR
jgi:hypothetical protein